MIKQFSGVLTLAALALLTTATATQAESLIEPDYEGHYRATTKWYEYYSPANYKSDMDFIIGMRPHHAGALSMSNDYLASDKKSSARLQALAGGIIRNQTFEISMLDTVEGLIKGIKFEGDQPALHQVATKYLAENQGFMRAAPPPIEKALQDSDDPVSAEDVRFAKAMIIHHEGALMMCDDYLDNPNTNNGYVQRMCLDVLRDQAQEIQLMRNIVADYPGNPDDIKIDPSMIHGMDDMMHHMDMSSVQNMGDGKSAEKPHKMDHGMHHGH